jgi:hypothetical protein
LANFRTNTGDFFNSPRIVPPVPPLLLLAGAGPRELVVVVVVAEVERALLGVAGLWISLLTHERIRSLSLLLNEERYELCKEYFSLREMEACSYLIDSNLLVYECMCVGRVNIKHQ